MDKRHFYCWHKEVLHKVFHSEDFTFMNLDFGNTVRCCSYHLYTDMDWWQWEASSFPPPLLPHHQFSLHGWSSEWHLVCFFLPSPLPQHCKYISRGAECACPCAILNPCVAGLIPIIFLCMLLLWHCFSIVLDNCGQGCSLWPFFICYSLENWWYLIHIFTFCFLLLAWVWN